MVEPFSACIATTKGHTNQGHQKLKSTKYTSPMIQIKYKDNDEDLFTLLDTPNTKSHYSTYTI